jgi:ketosteroid isomerase-like protein
MSVQQHRDRDTIEHIFRAWDDALGARDLDASLALYHENATLEPAHSPLARHRERGDPRT